MMNYWNFGTDGVSEIISERFRGLHAPRGVLFRALAEREHHLQSPRGARAPRRGFFRFSNFMRSLVCACIAIATLGAEEFAPPLFVFHNGASFGNPQQQAAALKELGYDGIGSVKLPQLKERLAAFEEAGLRLFSIYTNATFNENGGSYAKELPESIDLLNGHKAIVELTLRGDSRLKNADELAVKVVREIADMAERAGLRVALYPHAGFYVARVPEALRIAKKVDRRNVGIMLNLCHFLKSEKPDDLQETIEAAKPYLFQASTCGADTDGKSWKQLIQPLDSGTFDQVTLLRLLKDAGFEGAVGLQCYGISDAPKTLGRSIAAWKKNLEAMRD